MSYNGSGTFQINTTGQPVVTGTVISSTAFNALTADLATGLSTAITKDGQTATTARIPFAQGISSTLVTDSSSISTGSIITAGGIGVAKAAYIGTTLNVASTTTVTGNVTAAKLIPTGTSVTGNGLYLPAANALGLSTNGTNAVYIDSSQNVGIGMTPTYKLDVTGSIRTSSVMYVAGGDSSIQRSGGNTWVVVSSNTGYGSNGVHLKLDSSTTAGFFGFYSQGTSILEAAGAGNTVVLQGGSTSAGTGIAFPATQNASANANTLDDYEEGTWSPSYSSSSGSGLVITTNSATYTKIGRAVTLSLDFTVTTVASSGGVIYINNLPFAGTTNNGSMCFRETAISGWSGAAQLSTTTQLQFSKYDGTSPIVASARPAGFLTYFTST
jgi:hypothetical protein